MVETVVQSLGLVATTTSQQYVLMTRLEIHLHCAAVTHGWTSHHDYSCTVMSYSLILEQVHHFPHLPPCLKFAPPYTFNEKLARVQLGSAQFSHSDPSSQAHLRLESIS